MVSVPAFRFSRANTSLPDLPSRILSSWSEELSTGCAALRNSERRCKFDEDPPRRAKPSRDNARVIITRTSHISVDPCTENTARRRVLSRDWICVQ